MKLMEESPKLSEERKVRINLWIPREIDAEVRRLARQGRRSLVVQVELLLEEALEQRAQEAA